MRLEPILKQNINPSKFKSDSVYVERYLTKN